MKLLSHNMLKSCCKGVKTGYPLRILVIMMGAASPAWCINVWCMLLLLLQPVKVEVKTVNFEPEFISRMIPKLEWSVLKAAAESVRTCLLNFILKKLHMMNTFQAVVTSIIPLSLLLAFTVAYL